jgi:hypothetical protein
LALGTQLLRLALELLVRLVVLGVVTQTQALR